MRGLPGWASPLVEQPYRRPCMVVPNPEDFLYCLAPSGEHTILELPVCDDCYEACRV